MQNEKKIETPKIPYTKPELKELGRLSTLIQGASISGQPDAYPNDGCFDPNNR